MSKNIDTLTSQLSSLGLSEEEIKVYLALVEGRGDTALALARVTGLARTRVYRLLDNLIAHCFVVTKLGGRGSRFVAAPIDSLDFLLFDREHELVKLRSLLPALKAGLSELSEKPADSSQVLYYHGLEGLKQVTYNSLRASGELLTFEIGTMNDFLSEKEAENLREKFVTNQIHTRTLTNATYLYPWTDVAEMVEKYWQIRHLAPGKHPFQFEILIYNDVYCMYRYHGSDIFCVEIHSQELADMQRQLFEYLWVGAKKFKVLDSHGAAQLL